MSDEYKTRAACGSIYYNDGDLEYLIERLKSWNAIKYAVLGKEVCPTSGRLHLQYYIEFSYSMPRTTFQNRAHYQCNYAARNGSPDSASLYCKKGEQSHKEWKEHHEHGENYGLNADFYEWGEISEQGKRTDLHDVIDDIQAGMKEHQLSLTHRACFRKHMKWCQRMIQLHGNHVERAEHSLAENCLNLRVHPIPFDHPDWIGSAAVGGNAGCGKTDFALSHFKNPLIVSHVDKLKCFNPNFHDGIVFDDMSFTHFPLSAQKHLLDWTNDREINVKHDIAVIPKHTRKIFTYNYGEFPFDETNTAIKDRLYVLETDRSLGSHRKMPKPQPFGPLDEQFMKRQIA